MNTAKYYLGLDIGTDSVGYAATNDSYDLMKFRGEPVWGVTTFEAASLAEERRINRTSRRRLDRRQHRVQLINEIFGPEICKIDPHFFVRRKESALFAEDSNDGVKIFDGGMTDREYHKRYPTIHHLIQELMTSTEPHDVRLVYLACAWLAANRGHFLSGASVAEVRDFEGTYSQFAECLTGEYGCGLPWPQDTSPDSIQAIMQTEAGVTRKKAMFKDSVYGGKMPSQKTEEGYPFKKEGIVTLLSGGKVAPKELFINDAYSDVDSVCLSMDEENFERVLEELGDDAQLLRVMRAMYDCVLLNSTLRGQQNISSAKVAVYNRHHQDLKFLKYFIRKYQKESYGKIFRYAVENNYVAYSGNVKNCANADKVEKTKKEPFCDYIRGIVSKIEPDDIDREQYDDMISRLSSYTFLPKQKDSDNRVIPHQLYEYELQEILNRARNYLPLLKESDSDGITNEEKIRAIFRFRIPYYVGPLNSASPNAWLERQPGKIYPWNFEKMVDLDISEQKFICRMTNTCTYLPGEDVLPYCSLLYSRFMVLNEINNLKINGQPISVSVKQKIFIDLFENSSKKVTLKTIASYLKSSGLIEPNDEISGVDTVLKSNLKSYHSFRRMLGSGILTEAQAEEIINHAAYSEDKLRMQRWLQANYPSLSDDDRRYILRLNLKKFGRLSRMFLTEIMGCLKSGNGEAMSIMDALWQTNDNLMQLLSDRYTFKEQVDSFTADYYSDPCHKKTLSERLDDMYVSNAVKRQIIRSLDICTDVVKAMGGAPERIFVEMARGGTPDQKGKRTSSRKQQILELYKTVKNEDTPRLLSELKAMGETADNRLQSDRLFLYYMQLGKCMYSGEAIDLSKLASETYDVDHIYPQSKVQDDSILNNKVLCLSTVNGTKDNDYPIGAGIQQKMRGFWTYLKDTGLITEEKFRRLTRSTGFTEDELHQFINRQLVETRRSTKVVSQLLKERYPETEIVYVKAGMVSRFRQEFDMLKCRSVNDLHHAKDAYLNIVVGNVYHEKFTRRWFDVKQEYTMNIRPLFAHTVTVGGKAVWQGEDDLNKVRKTMAKNAVHLTRYAFCRKSGKNGGLFDQMPLKAAEGLIPRKEGLPTEKYGGYNRPTASFYLLVSYTIGKKKDVMFAPVELRFADRVLKDPAYALEYIAGVVTQINGGKRAEDVRILLGGRPIKINAVLSLDGMPVTIRGKSNKGAAIGVSGNTPLIVGQSMERYIKRLDSYLEKKKTNPKLVLNEQYDHINAEDNKKLYDLLTEKMSGTVFSHCPGNISETLKNGAEAFTALTAEDQVKLLAGIVAWFGNVQSVDLKPIGGRGRSGTKRPSSKLSGLRKNYKDVRIVDMSAAGLFESRSENLLDLL